MEEFASEFFAEEDRKKNFEDEKIFDTPKNCEDAIHGRRVPPHITKRNLQLCVIRGIRHHFEFAQYIRGILPEITPELEKNFPEVPLQLTRALNARDIMSGVIPTLTSPEDTPYCIWHPDVPSEETLRALVQKYPGLLYHAARACAVGGYFDLYKELDPLPEVHVAEEAGYAAAEMGQNKTGSQEIYQYILSQPIKYAIMNDYKRTVGIDGRRIAPLNGDTAVYSSLQAGWAYHKEIWNGEYYNFNITEDYCIDDHDHKGPQKTPDDYFPLLYSPLPADLPLINKDKLFYVAAYNGDIDRYVRLKSPHTIPGEQALIDHGIYHSVLFAKWWSSQLPEHPTDPAAIWLRRSINARRIMSNDITWITADTPDELLPDCIWYPSFAKSLIYRKLAHIQPKLYKRCLRACIAAGYDRDWDNLLLSPPEGVPEFESRDQPNNPEELRSWRISRIVSQPIWQEAFSSRNKKFLEDICAAVPGISDHPPMLQHHYEPQPWQDVSSLRLPGHCDFFIHDPVHPSSGYGPYNGSDPEIGNIDLLVFTRDILGMDTWEEELRKRKEDGKFYGPYEFFDIVQDIKSS